MVTAPQGREELPACALTTMMKEDLQTVRGSRGKIGDRNHTLVEHVLGHKWVEDFG